MTTKKTLIALTASLGLGVLSVVALTACGDNPTDINPFDAGSDARPDTGNRGGVREQGVQRFGPHLTRSRTLLE